MVVSDVIGALRLCQRVEPTAELTIHTTKQGSYLFSVKIKGRVRFHERNALEASERLCRIAGVKPFEVKVNFPPLASIFQALYLERLRQYGFQRFRDIRGGSL